MDNEQSVTVASLKELNRQKGKKQKKKSRLPRGSAEYRRVKSAIGRLNKRITTKKAKLRTRRDEWASEHFRIREFDCRDGTPVPKAAYPALRKLCRDYLEPLRDKYGPVHINSGHRTTFYNRAIGGASLSEHIYDASPEDVAADVTTARGTPAQVYAYLDSLGVPGLGRYPTFTHLDNGARRRWSG